MDGVRAEPESSAGQEVGIDPRSFRSSDCDAEAPVKTLNRSGSDHICPDDRQRSPKDGTQYGVDVDRNEDAKAPKFQKVQHLSTRFPQLLET